jgi:CelD/BcsL family acetyltransferase involved in cellulose biosynthesis
MFGSVEVSRPEAGWATPLGTANVEPAPVLVLDTAEDLEALQRLAPEWRPLMARAAPAGSIYQSFEWAAASAARLDRGARLCILLAREEGRLVAVAPLVFERRLGLPALRWLGGSLTIYGDVLAEAGVDVPDWLSRALGALAARGEAHNLFLENVRADARIAPFLADRGRPASSQSAPWIDMAGLANYDAWRARQSRATRRGRARRLKQLETAGPIEFVFEPAGPSTSGLIVRLFEMKRDWAHSRKVISRTIWDADFESLVASLASDNPGKTARVSALLLAGQPIAIELGFAVNGVYASYLGAYDTAYEDYSPGVLQLERTIEACFAEGFKVFDLQPPADAYKQSIAWEAMPVTSYALPLTRMGRLQSIAAAINPVGLAKRGIDVMPAPCRSAVFGAFRYLASHRARRLDSETRATTPRRLRQAIMLLGASGIVAAALSE